MGILALDIGSKRIGLALSSAGIYASEYGTLTFLNMEDFLSQLEIIIEKETIGKIIIGLPLSKDGEETEEIINLVKEVETGIKKISGIAVKLEDERFTSLEAARRLKEEGLDLKKINNRIDQKAAKIILEQYLEKNGNT